MLNIKLIAVACNEACYLPEWILHHVYFGFDCIDIHVNRTTDNTFEIQKLLTQFPHVNLIDADAHFPPGAKNPQVDLYREEMKKAYKQGFSHVMLLDIDEFWTPLDLKTSIKDATALLPDVNTVSFEWQNKIDTLPFGFVIEPSNSTPVARVPQLKSLFKMRPEGYRMLNPHSSRDEGLTRALADGSLFYPTNVSMSQIDGEELRKPPKASFILHRLLRSEFEFIASLSRLNPRQSTTAEQPLKNNRRSGFRHGPRRHEFVFEQSAFDAYRTFMVSEMAVFSDILETAKQFIREEFNRTLDIINNAQPEAFKIISDSLQGVSNEQAQQAIANFKRKAGL